MFSLHFPKVNKDTESLPSPRIISSPLITSIELSSPKALNIWM